MNILAIDPGSKTGWACSTDGRIESGVQHFSLKRGESQGMRFMLFRTWIRQMLDYALPELVIYEMAHHRGGSATELLIGMTTRIQEECEGKIIEYTSIHSATLKKFATGKGNSGKKAMLKEARYRFGKHVKDHNEADALLMLDYAREEYT